MTKTQKFLVIGVAIALPGASATLTGLFDGEIAGILNQSTVTSKKATKEVVVFRGDTVIPQIVDGGGWKTTITLINLENRIVVFDLLFFQDSGFDLRLPIIGIGVVRGIRITLGIAEQVTVQTQGTDFDTSQGWAKIDKVASADSVGGFAIFRQRIAGRPDQEAVVPIVNEFDKHFVLLFDNTDFTTAMAIANPSLQTVVMPVNIRAESGTILQRQIVTLGPFQHVAFAIEAQWAITAGRRGVIEFETSTLGVAVLGLRFGGSAFTSFHVLSNIAWVVP